MTANVWAMPRLCGIAGVISFYTKRDTIMNIEEYLKKETQPRKAELWGNEIEFTPYLCKTILGDGLQVIYFGTLDQRPAYWIVRIDSKTDISSDGFDLEAIVKLVEDECGTNSPDLWESEEEYMSDNFHYPMVDYHGGHSGVMMNFSEQTHTVYSNSL